MYLYCIGLVSEHKSDFAEGVGFMHPSSRVLYLFILHPIVKTLTPLESSQLSGSDDMHHYLMGQRLAVCPIRKVRHK